MTLADRSTLFFILASIGLAATLAGQQPPSRPFDVLNYAAHIEPDLARTVAGRVTITFVASVDTLSVVDFDAGDLVIETVRTGRVAQPFVKNGRGLRVSLTPPLRAGEQRSVDVVYHGAPRSGVQFHPERSQLYTIFSTSQWLVADPRAITLGAHELAHQWWGNRITCRDWTDFWLNEGFATFMTAAYKEHRFGREEYLREVEQSRLRYEAVRSAGGDKPLVFPDWARPTANDWTLVYHKGAYVLHLLREKLGDEPFWAAIRHYTRTYLDRSVTTQDFQAAVEQSSGTGLSTFFEEWIAF